MLILEVVMPEIFAYYQPPTAGPNVGGYLGTVFPGGSFLGLRYDALFVLGTGYHEVIADERAERSRGNEPEDRTDDEARVRDLRLSLFMDRVGICTEGEVMFRALLAMTPGNVGAAVRLMPAEWQRRLRDFAAEIPTYRARGGVRSFGMGIGTVTQIPDENLGAVYQWFASRH